MAKKLILRRANIGREKQNMKGEKNPFPSIKKVEKREEKKIELRGKQRDKTWSYNVLNKTGGRGNYDDKKNAYE